MQTFVVQSQKGGSGKTTLSAHLAVEAERCGLSAWVIDTDPQGTLSQWHDRRVTETPQRFEVPAERVGLALEKIAAQGGKVCFIDCAPSISVQNTALLALADFVLVPVRPSPADLWAVGPTVALVKAAGKPFVFVVTQAKARATITAQAAAVLSQHGRVAEAFVTDRVAYAAAMRNGQTAPEMGCRHEAAEVAALWQEILLCCSPQNGTAAKVVQYG